MTPSLLMKYYFGWNLIFQNTESQINATSLVILQNTNKRIIITQNTKIFGVSCFFEQIIHFSLKLLLSIMLLLKYNM